MIKKCQKCNQEFNCRHDDIVECHCVSVPLSDAAKRYLEENYSDCLCNKCLKDIADMFLSNVVRNKH